MERVGVRELRQNLSVYLRRVKIGERLEVIERGRVVARLEPVVADDDPIARLERDGRILSRSTRDLSKIRPLRLELERPLGEDSRSRRASRRLCSRRSPGAGPT